MRFLLTVILALVLVTVESVAVRYLGFSVTRIDVTVALVVFLAMRAPTLEGAFASFAIGYVLDAMSGAPTGLYPFLAVLTFLGARMASSIVEVRSVPMFALFVAGSDFGHGLLAAFFTWLTSKSGGAFGLVSGLPLQVLLTAAAGVALWPLLRRIDPGTDRPEVGALR